MDGLAISRDNAQPTNQTAPIPNYGDAPYTRPNDSPWAALAPQRRCTMAVTRRRVDLVACAILDGVDSVRELLAWSDRDDPDSGRPWHVTPRTIMKYRKRAYQIIADEARDSRDMHMARQLGIRRRLYATAVGQCNVPAALAVAKDESELLGLYPDKAAPIGTTNINLIAASVQQAIADPRYIAWLESQPQEPQALASNAQSVDTPVSTELAAPAQAPDTDDLPSCDELDAYAIDHI